MSDLNDFFAKKDRKKKKASSRLATQSLIPSTEAKKVAETPAEAQPGANPPAPPKQPDDGWIEIEDPRGAQVNTGGRTVAEMKRGAEVKDNNADGSAPTEKFSGWIKADQEELEEDGEVEDDSIAQAPSSAFPTLADSANAPEVPVVRSKPGAASSFASAPNRRRFINSNAEALRKKLAERATAPGNK